LQSNLAWLGEPLPSRKQAGSTPFAPRCIKDMIEESLFVQRRDPPAKRAIKMTISRHLESMFVVPRANRLRVTHAMKKTCKIAV